MDVASIQALMVSLQSATEVLKGLLKVKTSADVRAAISDIQSALLEAQRSAIAATAAQAELQGRVRELEAEIKAFNDWGSQESRYALVNPWRGPAQAFALREAHADGDVPHLLCPNCFLRRSRVILSPHKTAGKDLNMVCATCKATQHTGWRRVGPAKFAEEYLDPPQEP